MYRPAFCFSMNGTLAQIRIGIKQPNWLIVMAFQRDSQDESAGDRGPVVTLRLPGGQSLEEKHPHRLSLSACGKAVEIDS